MMRRVRADGRIPSIGVRSVARWSCWGAGQRGMVRGLFLSKDLKNRPSSGRALG